MPHDATGPQSTYLAMVHEAVQRLRSSESFLASYKASSSVPFLEAAMLQVRKALEALAFASIAPNKPKYEEFRARAVEQPDYTKDYHAGKILRVLGKINKNFYPLPLEPAKRKPDGTFHFDRKVSGYLTKKRFESFYDQLGKHLHAHNPWSNNKNLQNIASELPGVIDEALCLLEVHATFIRAPEFTGAWVVEAKRDGSVPSVITGEAEGEFLVAGS